jgi:hypothetical protein
MSTTVDQVELTERVVRVIAEAFGEDAYEEPSEARLMCYAGLALTLLDNAFGGDHAKLRGFIEAAEHVPRTTISMRPPS